jgi:hypothetical protein
MPARPQTAQDIQVQEWINTNNVEELATFLTENSALLEYNFVFYYDTGYGWGTNMEYTLLQQAVRKDKLDIVNLLLERGANPNNGGNAGTPPIFYAIFYESIFFRLIETGASLAISNAYGETLKNFVSQERNNPLVTKKVYDRVIGNPIVRNDYAIVDSEENIFGEEMEDGTTVAFLDPKFRGQRLVAVRANGTPTNSWKQILKDNKNPWTRAIFDPSKVELQKVVVGPSVNINGGKRKSRRGKGSSSSRHLRRKNRTQRRRK